MVYQACFFWHFTGPCYHGTNSDFERCHSKTVARLEHFCPNAFSIALKEIVDTQLQQQTSSAVFLVCALDFREAYTDVNALSAADLNV